MRSWFERQKNLLDFALSSLWRRRRRNAALLLVYAGVVFLLASVAFFTQALKREASLVLRGSPEVVVQRLMAGRHDLIPLAYADKLGGLRGVVGIRGRLWGYHYDYQTRANYTFLVPEDALPGPGQVFLGAGVARARGVAKGGQIVLKGADGTHRRFTVAGTFSGESELVTSDLILISETDFRGFFGMPDGQATDLVLKVRNPREVSTVAAKVQSLLPDTRVILRDDILRTYDSVFDWRAGFVVVVLVSCLLSFVILAWDKASGLSAEERREIGVLKAVGWETSDVLLLKFWEGTAISLTAFLAGTIAAFAQVFLAGAPLFSAVLKGWSTLYPAFSPAPFVAPEQVGILFVLTVVPYTVATIAPSWRAATIDPDSVMR